MNQTHQFKIQLNWNLVTNEINRKRISRNHTISIDGKQDFEVSAAKVFKGSLYVLKRLKLSQYGEEQVDFLRYRPVLSNKRLKEEFQYTPMKTSLEVFEYYMFHRFRENVMHNILVK